MAHVNIPTIAARVCPQCKGDIVATFVQNRCADEAPSLQEVCKCNISWSILDQSALVSGMYVAGNTWSMLSRPHRFRRRRQTAPANLVLDSFPCAREVELRMTGMLAAHLFSVAEDGIRTARRHHCVEEHNACIGTVHGRQMQCKLRRRTFTSERPAEIVCKVQDEVTRVSTGVSLAVSSEYDVANVRLDMHVRNTTMTSKVVMWYIHIGDMLIRFSCRDSDEKTLMDSDFSTGVLAGIRLALEYESPSGEVGDCMRVYASLIDILLCLDCSLPCDLFVSMEYIVEAKMRCSKVVDGAFEDTQVPGVLYVHKVDGIRCLVVNMGLTVLVLEYYGCKLLQIVVESGSCAEVPIDVVEGEWLPSMKTVVPIALLVRKYTAVGYDVKQSTRKVQAEEVCKEFGIRSWTRRMYADFDTCMRDRTCAMYDSDGVIAFVDGPTSTRIKDVHTLDLYCTEDGGIVLEDSSDVLCNSEQAERNAVSEWYVTRNSSGVKGMKGELLECTSHGVYFQLVCHRPEKKSANPQTVLYAILDIFNHVRTTPMMNVITKHSFVARRAMYDYVASTCKHMPRGVTLVDYGAGDGQALWEMADAYHHLLKYMRYTPCIILLDIHTSKKLLERARIFRTRYDMSVSQTSDPSDLLTLTDKKAVVLYQGSLSSCIEGLGNTEIMVTASFSMHYLVRDPAFTMHRFKYIGTCYVYDEECKGLLCNEEGMSMAVTGVDNEGRRTGQFTWGGKVQSEPAVSASELVRAGATIVWYRHTASIDESSLPKVMNYLVQARNFT
jgi:hypothetical protein